MKRFIAILFSVLLVWAQFAPAQAVSPCPKPAMAGCGMGCGHMTCCAAKRLQNHNPRLSPPAQNNAQQNQISLLVPAMVVWILPAHPADLFSSASVSPLMATGTPLYERNCALLL
ncbi:MAG: hypothetical protein WDM76_08685 [Limisphaerales bacterium]